MALGANLPSKAGPPCSTIKAIRPLLKKIIQDWINSSTNNKTSRDKSSENLHWRWSPLFKTKPLGGPKDQSEYINAVVVINGPKLAGIKPSEQRAEELLDAFLCLEKEFGRDRQSISQITWGPRTLDIDLLAWGDLQMKTNNLTLPHPRFFERSFVIVPLAAALTIGEKVPTRLPSQSGWPE